MFGRKRQDESEASLRSLLFDIAGTVCDEAVARALPPGPGSNIKWREGLLMNVALGLVGAQFALILPSDRTAKALQKLPDWVKAAEIPRVGEPTAERGAKIVYSVMGRGLLLAKKNKELPDAYFLEVADMFEGFGFDVPRLAASFAVSMRDWRMAISTTTRT